MRRECAFICFMVVTATAVGQVPVIPDSLIRQGVVIRTDRFEGTHTTSLGIDFSHDGDTYAARGRALLSSTTTFLGSSSTRDGMDAVLDIEYQGPRAFRLFVLSEGTLANDVRADVAIPGFEKTASGLVALGARLYDDEGGRIGVAIGGAYNRQLNVEDRGLALYTEVVGRRSFEDYDLTIDGQYRTSSVDPRLNSNGYGQLHVARMFEEGGSATLDIHYDLANSDLYIARSIDEILQLGGTTFSGLRQRSERKMRSSATLAYPIDPTFSIDFSLGLSTYGVGQQQVIEVQPPSSSDPDPFRFDRDELGISMSASANWDPGEMRMSGRFEYWTSEERNTVQSILPVSASELDRQRSSSAQNDYAAQQVRLVGDLQTFIGGRDTVSLGGSVGIYRYDTPSPVNAFDRDEQSIHAEARWDRSFSELLRLNVVAQAFLTHLVYLFGENSNDNNWNRIFRFSPTVVYSGEGFRNNLVTELAANYTEYDFQDRSQTVRGRSFREMRILDSMAIGLTTRTHLRVAGELRIAERGSFNWERFVESPLERTRTEGMESEMFVILDGGLQAGAGGRLARVKIFRTGPGSIDLQPFSDRTSVGPTARIEFRPSSATEVVLSGWWEHRFDDSRLAARLPWLNLSARWHY